MNLDSPSASTSVTYFDRFMLSTSLCNSDALIIL
jgi:hypothetical protein